jgi:hypothetical protein
MTSTNEFPVRANVVLFLPAIPFIEEEPAALDAGGVRGGVWRAEKGRKNDR